MKPSRLASLFLAFALVTPAIFAAEDVSGKWSGSFKISIDGGAEGNETAYMVLKHTGKELSGTAGPNENQQWPILKGTVTVTGTSPKESTRLSFAVHSEAGNGPMIHFELELVDGHLKGGATAQQGTLSMAGTLDLTRVK